MSEGFEPRNGLRQGVPLSTFLNISVEDVMKKVK